MPQSFQVLRCYKCEVFQVHPTKKSNKWKCKLCDEKQSIKRFYGLGTGKECRLQVQKLNGIRGELDNTHCGSDTSEFGTGSESSEHSGQNDIPSVAKKSKWLDYVETQMEENRKPEEEQVSADIIMHLNNTEVVLELPKRRPRKSFTVTNKIVSKNENKCSEEKYSQPASLSNNNTKTLMQPTNSYKKNVKNYQSNPNNNVPAPTIIVNNSKWAKFEEGTQDCQDVNAVDPITYTNNRNFMFLEDEDIDSVLKF